MLAQASACVCPNRKRPLPAVRLTLLSSAKLTGNAGPSLPKHPSHWCRFFIGFRWSKRVSLSAGSGRFLPERHRRTPAPARVRTRITREDDACTRVPGFVIQYGLMHQMLPYVSMTKTAFGAETGKGRSANCPSPDAFFQNTDGTALGVHPPTHSLAFDQVPLRLGIISDYVCDQRTGSGSVDDGTVAHRCGVLARRSVCWREALLRAYYAFRLWRNGSGRNEPIPQD